MSTESLETMFQFFSDLQPPLKARLWQVCAMRVAVNVLSKVPSYQASGGSLAISDHCSVQSRELKTLVVEVKQKNGKTPVISASIYP